MPGVVEKLVEVPVERIVTVEKSVEVPVERVVYVDRPYSSLVGIHPPANRLTATDSAYH